jgi:hypothetical protein
VGAQNFKPQMTIKKQRRKMSSQEKRNEMKQCKEIWRSCLWHEDEAALFVAGRAVDHTNSEVSALRVLLLLSCARDGNQGGDASGTSPQ